MPKRDELKGKWRKLHNEELNDLSCSPNIVRVIILLRGMRWVGRRWVHPVFLWGNLRERVHWEDPGVDERKILRWIIREWDGTWTGLIWLRIGTGGWLL